MSAEQRYVSNDLSHFVGRSLKGDEEAQYLLLVKILREGRLLANPPPSDPDSTGYSINKSVKFSSGERYGSMSHVCFCDIPEHDVAIHVKKYSRFGVSFPKAFLVERGANPVYYVALQSPYLNMGTRREYIDKYVQYLDRSRDLLRERGYTETTPGTREWTNADDQLAAYVMDFCENAMLLFVKWFDADLAHDDADNFYMEREWRTLQTIHFSLSNVSRIFIPKRFAGSVS